MKKHLIILSIFFFIIGCKKQQTPSLEVQRTSYWQVNNDSFSTNETATSHSFGAAVLSSLSTENGFSILLMGEGRLPHSGSMRINIPSTGLGGAQVEVYYKSKLYNTPCQPGTTSIEFSSSDDKAILTIPPIWLRQWNDTIVKDSVLFQGVLSEP